MRPKEPAPPGEWHPWFQRSGFLEEWVSGKGREWVRIIVPLRPRYEFNTPFPESLMFDVIVLERYQVRGFAPYVGRPFLYEWYVGVDKYGRQIASDSWIRYYDRL